MDEVNSLQQQVEQLQQRVDLLECIVNSLPQLIYAKDENSRFLYANKAQLRLLQAEAVEDILGKTDKDFFPEKFAAKYLSDERDLLNGGDPIHYVEEEVIDPDGSLRWLRTTKIPTFAVDDHINGLVGIGNDITPLIVAQEQLRQRESSAQKFHDGLKKLHEVVATLSGIESVDQFLRSVIELGLSELGFDRMSVWLLDQNDTNFAQGTYGVDESGNIRDERHIRTEAGKKEGYIHATTYEKGVFVRQGAPIYDHQENVVGQGWNIVSTIRNGEQITGWMSADNLLSATPLDHYRTELFILYSASVGQLYAQLCSQNALRESEERFRQITENLHDSVIVYDAIADRTLYANPSAEQIWHVSRKRLMEDPFGFLDSVHPEDRKKVLEAFESTAAHKIAFELRVLTPEKKERWVWIRRFPILNDAGQVHRQIKVAEDITEQKQAQQQKLALVMAEERNRVMHEFIKDAYHEFRTPLTLINTRLYLASRVEDKTHQQTHLDEVRKQADNIMTLVDALLTMIRLDQESTTDREIIDINRVLREVFTSIQTELERSQHTVVWELSDKSLFICSVVTDFWPAVRNIFENAIRFMPQPGTITVRSFSRDGKAVIEIQDEGVGIAADQIPYIFDRFFRLDKAHTTRGFGLGLAIAKRVIERDGGCIEVDSKVDHGSTFRILLSAANRD